VGADQPVTAGPAGPEETSRPAWAGTVDESTLTEEQRRKLRVLRRITGGRVSDAELLARIEAEAGRSAAPGGERKKKSRWWGG